MNRLTAICLVAVLGAAVAHPQPEPPSLTGIWRHHHQYYQFTTTGIMTSIRTDSAPRHYRAYHYEVIPSEAYTLVRFGIDTEDTASCEHLMVRDLMDSTATIAYGRPFVREGDGTGLKGTWVHADDLTIITWQFDRDTVSYRQDVLDLDVGEFVIAESHTGTFARGTRERRGVFSIEFDDGSRASVFPLISGDVMHLFDLTGRQAAFVRAESAPTWEEYRAAVAGITADEVTQETR